jgi:hypothetical protein
VSIVKEYFSFLSQVALGASLGIAEPQLMKVMRATLFTHTQWFKVQMCTDRFADFLNINTLKEPDTAAETSESTMEDLKTVGGSGSCISTSEMSGTQLSEGPRDGPLFDDGSILTLVVNFLIYVNIATCKCSMPTVLVCRFFFFFFSSLIYFLLSTSLTRSEIFR